MQQTQLKWIAQWYQQASDYVMAFSGQWELLWQNRPCPMLQNITDFGSFFPFSPNDKTSSRTSTICHIGELYRVHCDRNLTDGTPLFLVRIDALPYGSIHGESGVVQRYGKSSCGNAQSDFWNLQCGCRTLLRH